MARMPAGPIDEEGKTVFPASTEDDVQGHGIVFTDEVDEDELAEPKPAPK